MSGRLGGLAVGTLFWVVFTIACAAADRNQLTALVDGVGLWVLAICGYREARRTQRRKRWGA